MICPAGQGPHLSETTLFHPRMICPAGQGPHLPETTRCAGWRAIGSKSSRGRFLIHMDAQDAQDFFRRRLACIPGHPQIRTRSSPESAFRAAASGPNYPVHPVHPCSIYNPSRLFFPVAGLGCAQRPDSQSASRAAASGPINPKFLTHRQDNSFIFNHHSRILGCVAWEHPDEFEGPLLKRGRLGQSLDARRVRFGGQSALMAGPRPHLRHQRLQAMQR